MDYSMNYGSEHHGNDAFAQWTSLICNPKNERTEREITQMSEDDRSEMYADLGGAVEINPEEPDFVNRCLMELNEHIMKIPQKDAFTRAQQMSPHYTNNPGFRLKFLRADNFSPEKAARRIVMHFEEKLDLFGPEKLARDITLADMNIDDLDALATGGVQCLPEYDRFGRIVICSRQVFWKYKKRENLRRSLWYMIMSSIEDEEAQRRGLVAIGYSIGKFHRGTVDLEMHRQFIKTGTWLPVRISAVYFCFNNPRFVQIAEVVTHMFSSFLRVRFRPIQGTRQECNYQLMLMGINHNEIPSAEDGDLLVENHLAWIRQRQEIESARKEAIQHAMAVAERMSLMGSMDCN